MKLLSNYCRPLIYLAIIACLFFSCSKNSNSSGTSNTDLRIQKRKVLVILGSSTAAGTGANPIDSSWVNRLNAQLSIDERNTQVINLAMGGYNTSKIVPSSYKTADTSRNITKAISYGPEMIIINLPSNDFADGYTDEQILNNYSLTVHDINAAHIQYLITSTQPRNFSSLDLRKRVALFNDKMESAYPGHILNYYWQLASSDYTINPIYSYGDGVHVNNKGHYLIFQSVVQNNTFKNIFY
jgi:acyl-CoA thioesterase-1